MTKIDPTYGFPINTNTRMSIVILIEAINSVMNGDPDRGGAPRLTFDGRGKMTDVAFKRKIRDYLALIEKELHMERGALLDEITEGETPESMLAKYVDLRLFGGLLPKFLSAGRIRGPMVFGTGETIDPVVSIPETITRVAGYSSEEEGGNDRATMGIRHKIPYGLYRIEGNFDVFGGRQTGLTERDLALFWEALFECWEHTRSTSRPNVNLRRVFVFQHPNERGCAPSHVLREMVKVENVSDSEYPVRFSDYSISVDHSRLPDNVTLYSWEDGIVTALTNEGPPATVAAK